MQGTLEIRGLIGLQKVFAERKWTSPYYFPVDHDLTGHELVVALDLPPDAVEYMILNRKVQVLETVIHPGDRVALVPPGTPGPYRVFLGAKSLDDIPKL